MNHPEPISHHSQNTSDPRPTRPGDQFKGMTTLQLTALLDALVDEVDVTATTDMPCRVFDAELWFAESPADVEHAKALCLDCPVRSACLAGALERHEPWGVWGGELFASGVVVPRKRPRGRPRKCEVAA
jgi:WhiB family redox-sensing transcriptional regulator